MKAYIVPCLLSATILQSDVQIYSIPSIFPSEQSKISSNFITGLSKERDDLLLGREFVLSTSKDTFKTVQEIDKMNVNKTFISYLKIPRVSLYEVPKTKDRTDYYLPISATFTIANMKTGEIVYSGAYTNYSVYEGLSSGISNEIQIKTYNEGFKTLTSELISKAKVQFNPFNIETKVIKKYDNYYILNTGLEGGIAVGDNLESSTAELKIIYSAKDYSIASLVLGNTKEGEILSKSNSGKISSLKRPKVGLVENTENYQGFSWEILKQFFTDSIGEKATFSILPLDKTFYDAQEIAFAEAKSGLSQENRNKRVAPSIFVKMDIGTIYSWKTPSDKDYAYFDNYAINSCAAMINNSGIISGSTCETEMRNDIVFGNTKFSNDASTEIVTKNSILKIAEKFSNDIKPSKKQSEVVNVKNGVIKLASSDTFKNSENVVAFRNIGKIDGIKNILIPIAETIIMDDDTSTAKELGSVNIKENDILMVDTLGSNSSAKILKFEKAIQLEGEKLDDFEMMAPYIVSSNSKYNFLAWDNIKNDIEKTFTGDFGFAKNTKLSQPKTNLTAIPRYQVALKEQNCNDSDICTSTYNIYSDIKIYKGDISESNVVFDGGYETDISLKHPKDAIDKINYELNEEALKLLIKATKDISL